MKLEKAHSDFCNFAPKFIPRKPHTCLEGDKTIIFIAALHVMRSIYKR